MWVRTIKITFANELMKNSVRSYMSETVDLTEGMLLVYRVDLAANVSLVNHFFPDRETLEGFSEKLKPVREQLKSMGAKVEINDGRRSGCGAMGRAARRCRFRKLPWQLRCGI